MGNPGKWLVEQAKRFEFFDGRSGWMSGAKCKGDARFRIFAEDFPVSLKALHRFLKTRGWRVSGYSLNELWDAPFHAKYLEALPGKYRGRDRSRVPFSAVERALREAFPPDSVLSVTLDFFQEIVYTDELDVAYHLAPKKFVPEILRRGLSTRIPGSQGGSIFNRGFGPKAVYVFTDREDANRLSGNIISDHKEDNPAAMWALLELSDLEGQGFFYDCEYYGGTLQSLLGYRGHLLFTKRPIPPEKIKVLDPELKYKSPWS